MENYHITYHLYKAYLMIWQTVFEHTYTVAVKVIIIDKPWKLNRLGFGLHSEKRRSQKGADSEVCLPVHRTDPFMALFWCLNNIMKGKNGAHTLKVE